MKITLSQLRTVPLVGMVHPMQDATISAASATLPFDERLARDHSVRDGLAQRQARRMLAQGSEAEVPVPASNIATSDQQPFPPLSYYEVESYFFRDASKIARAHNAVWKTLTEKGTLNPKN